MGATGKTNYYELPLFMPQDATSWATYNQSMQKIDTIIHQIAQNSGGEIPPDLMAKIIELENEIEQLNSKQIDQNENITNLNQLISNTNSKVTKNEVDIEEIENNINSLETDIDTLKTNKENIETSISEIQSTINNLETVDVNLESNISNLQSEIVTTTTAITNIENDIEALQNEIANVNLQKSLFLLLNTNSTNDWTFYKSTDGITFSTISLTSPASLLYFINIGNGDNIFLKGNFKAIVSNIIDEQFTHIRLIKDVTLSQIGQSKRIINQAAVLNIYTPSSEGFVLRYSFPVHMRVLTVGQKIQLILTIVKDIAINANLMYEWVF